MYLIDKISHGYQRESFGDGEDFKITIDDFFDLE